MQKYHLQPDFNEYWDGETRGQMYNLEWNIVNF